jgi:hypothetical protein
MPMLLDLKYLTCGETPVAWRHSRRTLPAPVVSIAPAWTCDWTKSGGQVKTN